MAVAALAPAHGAATTSVAHPLLQNRLTSDGGETRFSALLDSRSQWVLAEHRVRGAEPVLPGTGFVEIVRAALVHAGVASDGQALELTDVGFTSPLVLPEKTPRVVNTEVRADSDGSFTVAVRSEARRGTVVEHTTGRGRAIAWSPAAIDIAAIEARCTARRETFEPGEQLLPQERLLGFGPRWKTLRRVSFGAAEAVAHLQLADAYAADLTQFGLHPALLDIATGCAFSLIEQTGVESALFVPLSYGRLRVAGHLPARIVSHVRLRPGSSAGLGVLDATLADEHGRVVAEIEGYVVKAVEPKVLKAVKTEAGQTPLERWVEQGIRPDEGFDLLGRIIGQHDDVQVLVSPLDVHAMIAELRAPERPAAAAAAGTAASTSAADVPEDRPRDEIEQKLAALWAELLGVERVRLQDAFFDLGGHSLIAVRLFARIRKTWGVDLPLATLFRAPTLEALAAAVREPLGLTLEIAATADAAAVPAATAPAVVRPKSWSPLVQIRKGGSRRPFFCVHGAGGNLLNFHDFTQQLSPEQPVYGLEARGVDGQQPPAASIEEMAALYLEAVRSVQPHGPYVLGGYSGGGVVALEMARLLELAGERAAEVILLDTFHPATRPRTANWREKLDDFRTKGFKYVLTIAGGIVIRHTTWRMRNRRLRQLLSRSEAIPHELREWHITTAFLDALRRLVPAAYTGAATMFRAQEIGLMYQHVGERLGWEPEVLPRLSILEVPGTHDTLVREPNVKVLSAGLDAVLKRASEA